jgi:hypothetical protein
MVELRQTERGSNPTIMIAGYPSAQSLLSTGALLVRIPRDSGHLEPGTLIGPRAEHRKQVVARDILIFDFAPLRKHIFR